MYNLNDDILSHTAEFLSEQRRRAHQHKIVRFLIVLVLLGITCMFILSHVDEWYGTLKGDSKTEMEFRSEWESTAGEINLDGHWSEDVLAIAESQAGYFESSSDEWSAVFASFCLDYANVENIPLETDCNRWVQKLREYGLFCEVNGYTPVPGDLIFFHIDDSDGSQDQKIPNHVGLVMEVTAASGTSPAKIKTIEGDSDDSVRYVVYDLTDDRIIGYGKLPEGPK